jgi:uncharacterized membrane protein
LLLMLLGAGFRLIPLGHEALDGDEIFSRNVALQTWTAAYVTVRNDMTHPPLHYALMKIGIAIWGASALGVRVVSLLAGIATIGLIAILGRRLPDARWCGLLAAACLAVGREQVFYSQEARDFSLHAMLVILLVLWVDAISKHGRNPWLWASGVCVMTLLVYMHSMGSLYVTMAILALVICKLEMRAKILAVASGAAAALLFTPWAFAVLSIYKSKGLNEALGWYGHPTFYDLRQLWASSIGIIDIPGATAAALSVIVVLAVAALALVSRKQTLRQSPTVVAMALMAVLPPLLVFFLSIPPFNLTLFALRHFLPSMAVLLLICCYGLERLSQASAGRAPLVAGCGAALLLFLGAAPTIKALRAGPARYPYDKVAERVEAAERNGIEAFAASDDVVGEPVNFYCNRTCVQPLPEDASALPPRLLLLYRPRATEEENKYRQLIQSEYTDVDHVFYTNGLAAPWGTMAASLTRQK